MEVEEKDEKEEREGREEREVAEDAMDEFGNGTVSERSYLVEHDGGEV